MPKRIKIPKEKEIKKQEQKDGEKKRKPEKRKNTKSGRTKRGTDGVRSMRTRRGRDTEDDVNETNEIIKQRQCYNHMTINTVYCWCRDSHERNTEARRNKTID